MKKIERILDGIRYGDHYVKYTICHLNIDGDYFNVFVYKDRIEDVPVFHVVDANINEDTVVCIFEPTLYQDSHKVPDPENIPFLLDLFDKALHERCTTINPDLNLTNWEYIVRCWRTLNDNYDPKYDVKNAVQPDYTKLDQCKPIRRSFARMLISKLYA